jgi:SAM-dependent methyltransferase
MLANWKVDYSQTWSDWVDVAERQHYKDVRLFLPLLELFPKTAKVLEIGAGVGQLSALVKSVGFEFVVASDIEPNFVNYMKQNGINARLIDILDINSYSDGIAWDIIFSQGASPFLTGDMTVVEQAYRSIYKALSPGGVFLYIGPRHMDPESYCRPSDHKEIYLACGFKEKLLLRQQALPAHWYRYGLSMVAEDLFGRFWGVRDVFVLEKEAVV